MRTYRYESHLDASPAHAFAWHERPGAFERLAPPWADVRVIERDEGIRDGARVAIEVHKGPLRLRGTVRHMGYVEGEQFQDEQVSGPFASWVHTHRFEPAEGGGCRVVDDVAWELPIATATELVSHRLVDRELSRLFPFRHERLRNDLTLHRRYAHLPRKTVAISGSTGFIGSALRHFLTAGGHRVVPMVRRRELDTAGTIHYDWRNGKIDRAALERVDAVVHLAGEPLLSLRWTREKKRAILDSRVKSTELIAQTMAELHSGPTVLLSASGVHYYGNRGHEVLTEESKPGKGFLSEVCQGWEAATSRAERSGVRVVRLRTGLVLSPTGGALGKLLLPFQVGVGGRIGSGRQYQPWIDLDDHVGIMYHALMDENVSGPLNLTAPQPVPQTSFAGTLGRVLGRPTVVPLPSLAVRALMGEFGETTLLEGQRAKPVRTQELGYEFLYDELESSLRFQLGRPEALR